MKSVDELHQLCHSLRKGERSAFRRWAGQGSGREEVRYLLLYDAMLEVAENEVGEVPGKLGMKKGSAYSTLRNYLFEQILKFLAEAQTKKQVKIQLRRWLDQINILRSRNLFSAAQKVLRKAKKLALQYEEHTYLLELGQLETILAIDTADLPELDRFQKGTPSEISNSLGHLRSYFQIMKTYSSFLNWVHTKRLTLPPGDLQAEWTEELDEVGKADRSVVNQLLISGVQGTVASLAGSPENALHFRKKTDSLFKENPQFIRERLTQYSANLYNLANSAMLTENYPITEKCIQELVELEKKFPDTGKKEYFQLTKIRAHQLNILLNTLRNDWEAVIQTHEAVQKLRNPARDSGLIHEYHASIDLTSVFAFLFLKRFPEGQKILNNLINTSEATLRVDIRLQAHLMRLVIHDHLGDQDLVDYFLRGVNRSFSSEVDEGSFEREVLAYLKARLALPGKAVGLERLRQEFLKKTEELADPAVLKRFDSRFGNHLLRRFIAGE